MSKLRSINTSIWSDPWIEELDPTEKLLFIYLITNEKTNMLGIYEASIKKISFETGIDKSKVDKALKGFERVGKVKYTNNYIILVNFIKHQNFNPNMKKNAIDIYNNLPKSLNIKTMNVSKDNPLKGFETLCKALGMVSKVEVEVEVEEEDEIEEELEDENKNKKVLMSEANASDVSDLNKDFFELGEAFYKLLRRNSEEVLDVNWKHLNAVKANDFIAPIRLLVEQDNRTIEEIKKVGNFLYEDDFWMKNIQSTKKLREKFDQLITQAKNNKNGKQAGSKRLTDFIKSNSPHWDKY